MHMVAPKVQMQYWTDKFNDFLGWITAVNDDPDAALVHSASTSEAEQDVVARAKVDVEFQKAGVRGLTLMFSSGDDGVWDEKPDLKRFAVQWPSSNPYVTGVGGTEFGVCGKVGQEVAVYVSSPCYGGSNGKKSNGYSGGGFSNLYKTPSYQEAAKEQWYKQATSAKNLPAQSYWNRNGSGYPDISALAVSETLEAGRWSLSGGTSSSAPFFGGMVALLNDARLAKKMKPMGFINPWLYQMASQHPEAFNDVTKGDNFGASKKKLGFVSQKGWDPVTGLGTPNMGILVELATQASSGTELMV